MILIKFNGMPANPLGRPTHVHIETDAKEGFMRVGGTVGSSNFAAAYLSISLASAASLLFTNLRRAHKWLAVAFLGWRSGPDFHIFAGGLDGLGAGSHGDLFARLEPPRILS